MTAQDQAQQLIQQHGYNAFHFASVNFDKYNAEAMKPYTREQHNEMIEAVKLSDLWFAIACTIFNLQNQ